MSIDGELSLASIDPHLPTIDLHGLPRDAVAYEMDMFMAKHPNTCMRIIYGHGKGILKNAVTTFLKEQKEKGSIEDFTHEMSGASCIARVR